MPSVCQSGRRPGTFGRGSRISSSHPVKGFASVADKNYVYTKVFSAYKEDVSVTLLMKLTEDENRLTN